MSFDLPAMIFSAGFGTRMGDLTREVPKPMVHLGGEPMIARAINLLRDAGITRIVANAHYLADRMIPFLEDRGVFVVREEPEILDTGGGLRAALPHLGTSPVITLNPDALWLGENPILTLRAKWKPEMKALLMLVDQASARGTENEGDFSLEQGEIRRNGSMIYGGMQIIRTDGLGEILGDVFSLNTYWDHLAKTGPMNGVVHRGAWCDIGTPEGLAVAEKLLADV